MNKNLFRLVFKKKLGMLVPVAEVSPTHGKAAAGESRAQGGGGGPNGVLVDGSVVHLRPLAMAIGLLMAGWSGGRGWKPTWVAAALTARKSLYDFQV